MNPVVAAALTQMAAFRQADVDGDTLRLYADALAEESLPNEVIVRACRTIERTPRREGETAFPDFGTLLKACSMAKEQIRQDGIARLASTAPKALMPPEDMPSLTREEAKAFVTRLRADVEALRARH